MNPRNPLGLIRPTRRPIGPQPAPATPMHVEVAARGSHVVWAVVVKELTLRARLSADQARAMAARFLAAAEEADPTPEAEDAPLSPTQEELLADAMARAAAARPDTIPMVRPEPPPEEIPWVD